MNQRLLSAVARKLLPEMMIGVALACLAYFLFTKPMIASAAEANAKADALTGQLALLQQGPAEAPKSDHALAIDALASAITSRSETTRDPGSFFQNLSQLATSLEVQIDQVNPSTPRPLRTADGKPATSQPIIQQAQQVPGARPMNAGTAPPAAPAPPVAPPAPPAPVDLRTAYSIRVTGEFSRCLMLIDKLQTDLAFTTIKSVLFTPAGDDKPGSVIATIDTDHVAATPASLKPPAPAPVPGSMPGMPPGLMPPGPSSEGPRP